MTNRIFILKESRTPTSGLHRIVRFTTAFLRRIIRYLTNFTVNNKQTKCCNKIKTIHIHTMYLYRENNRLSVNGTETRGDNLPASLGGGGGQYLVVGGVKGRDETGRGEVSRCSVASRVQVCADLLGAKVQLPSVNSCQSFY